MLDEVDGDDVRLGRGGGGERETRRFDGLSFGAPRDASAGHHEAQLALDGDELLQHRAVPAVPALAPKAVEMAFEVLDVVAELHARAARAEARFDHGREPDRG